MLRGRPQLAGLAARSKNPEDQRQMGPGATQASSFWRGGREHSMYLSSPLQPPCQSPAVSGVCILAPSPTAFFPKKCRSESVLQSPRKQQD